MTKKKKITNTFYNSSFYKLDKISNAPKDTSVKFDLRGEITLNIINELKDKFGFVPENELTIPDEGKITWICKGFFKAADIEDVLNYLKQHNISSHYDKYTWVYKELPDGYLYSGWRTGRRTKIKPEDLPEDYIELNGYKKCGYLKTAGVSGLYYKPSPFHNHSFKDDFLFITYGDKKLKLEKDELWLNCDEYVFGTDIISVVFAIEKNNAENKELMNVVRKIKAEMVDQYNAFISEMIENGWREYTEDKKISKLEELRGES